MGGIVLMACYVCCIFFFPEHVPMIYMHMDTCSRNVLCVSGLVVNPHLQYAVDLRPRRVVRSGHMPFFSWTFAARWRVSRIRGHSLLVQLLLF